MLGEIVLSAFLQALMEKLLSVDLLKVLRQQGTSETLKRWSKVLVRLQAVLFDAEQKQVSNKFVRMWLDELQDLVYDLDDVLDELVTHVQLRKLTDGYVSSTSMVLVSGLLPEFLSSFSPREFVFNRNIESKIDGISRRLELIVSQKDDLGLLEFMVQQSSPRQWHRSESTSLVSEPCVYGRVMEKKKLIDLLFEEGDANGFSVVAIVGMGGLGKTTLCQLIYNDLSVKELFDLKAWVCASPELDVKRTTIAILNAVSGGIFNHGDLNLDQAQVKLYEALTDRKFLIVLDGVWSERYADWVDLQTPLRAGASGSKVLVTTRSKAVALNMGTMKTHSLKPLSDDDCWLLFQQHAFGDTNTIINPKLVAIGKRIVERCKGLPLAAKALGGLLRSKTEEKLWEEILHSTFWSLEEGHGGLFSVLMLSYHHLSPELKCCFAYCSVLPKDYEFEVKEIILLWMAQGLIQPKNRSMEDLGHEYFHALVSRSFFEESKTDDLRFKMHSLMSDLAQWAAGEMYLRLDTSEGSSSHQAPFKIRHLSFIRSDFELLNRFEALYEAKRIRTFASFGMKDYDVSFLAKTVYYDLIPKFECLRVLSLSGYDIVDLPSSFGNLKHLRYVDLSYTKIRELPETTSFLFNLETLLLINCVDLERLPSKTKRLLNLRHLDISGTVSMQEMPIGIGNLTNLQTLSRFVVGSKDSCSIGELKNLHNLQDRLYISGLENVISDQQALRACLGDKKHLSALRMEWDQCLNNSSNIRVEEKVIELLQPHKNLKECSLKGYSGATFPVWLGDHSFTNMAVVRLTDCKMCTFLPSLGSLPSLRQLHIEGVDQLKSIGPEFYGHGLPNPFPLLEVLTFVSMKGLTEWCASSGNTVFPFLQKLSIQDCPNLVGQVPDHLPSLRSLVISDCKQLVLSLSSLPGLCELEISGCKTVLPAYAAIDIGHLRELKLFRISELTCLREGFVRGSKQLESLQIFDCKQLLHLFDGSTELLPESLQSLCDLTIEQCDNLLYLLDGDGSIEWEQPISVLNSLNSLTVRWCPNLQKLPAALCSLRILSVKKCPKLIAFLEQNMPPSVTEIHLESCSFLKSPAQLFSCCDFLKSLSLNDCPDLLSIEKLPSCVESLSINDCPSLHSINQLPTSLDSLTISYCPTLLFIDQIPSKLRSLEIVLCEKLQLLGFGRGSTSHAYFSSFRVGGCPSLITLFGEGILPSFLRTLEVFDCPNLESFLAVRTPTTCTSLEMLKISLCEELKFLVEGLDNLHCLTALDIFGCASLVSFPEGGLPACSLRVLNISDCEKLEALPDKLHTLNSLQELRISDCPRILSFPYGGLPSSVTIISIYNVSIQDPFCEWQLHRMTALEQLSVVNVGCSDTVELFPDKDTNLPSSLTSLTVGSFVNLRFLSSCGIQNLSYLSIYSCRKLASFVENKLPPLLLKLLIDECPLLKQRCCETEEGRTTLSRIPFVEVDTGNVFHV